jgi:rubredoxin
VYRCNYCDYKFEEPKYIKDEEVIDYGIGSRWVTLFEGDVCPECEREDFEEWEDEEVE